MTNKTIGGNWLLRLRLHLRSTTRVLQAMFRSYGYKQMPLNFPKHFHKSLLCEKADSKTFPNKPRMRQKEYELAEKNINKNPKVLINPFKLIMN